MTDPMIVGIAWCSAAPILLPEVSQRSDPDLDTLRAACDLALRDALTSDPEVLAVVTNQSATSARVGQCLAAAAGWHGPVEWIAASDDARPTVEGTAGRRVALLVLADGSTSRTAKAPRALHPRAEKYDETLSAALASGHPGAVLALDRELASAVGADDFPIHRAAALLGGSDQFDATVHYEAAPYGVGYVVASWVPRPPNM